MSLNILNLVIGSGMNLLDIEAKDWWQAALDVSAMLSMVLLHDS